MKEMRMPAYITRALSIIKGAGKRGWPVGGCVRDALMGKEPFDYDIATNALPEETKQIFKDYTVIETGLKHGTVTVRIDGYNVEITTLRCDGEYTDSRHPESVTFTDSPTEDLARRDFTMNAIAYSQIEGFIDPFGGISDIEHGIIRCVGDPQRRFREDALRILRALRFSSTLGFEIEESTARAMLELCHSIDHISRERVREELVKMLCGKDLLRVLSDHADIICTVIPELIPCRGFDQRNPHHIYDVYEHCIHAAAATPPIAEVRMAALIHDIAKPDCFTLDAQGVGHSRGHAIKSAELARDILSRLRFDNRTKNRIIRLIELHDSYPKPNRAAVRRDIANCGADLWYSLEALRRGDSSAKAPGAYGDEESYFAAVRALADSIIAEGDCLCREMLAIKGGDIAPFTDDGKKIGAVIDHLLDEVIDGRIENDRDILIGAAKAMLTK